MIARLFLFIALFAVVPELLVNWSKAGSVNAIKITIQDSDRVMDQCLRSGLEVHYRFELMLCRRRVAWFDRCEERRVLTQSLQFDPISETYRIAIDKLGDKEPPVINNLTSVDDALAQVSTVEEVPLEYLGAKVANDLVADPNLRRKTYVGVRVLSACRGDYSATLERISSIVSLGFIRTSGFDSGWIDFRLDQ